MTEPLTDDRRAKLRRLAEAATPGERHVSYVGRYCDWVSIGRGEPTENLPRPRPDNIVHVLGIPEHSEPNHSDAFYFAATCPQTVLDLLDSEATALARAQGAERREAIFRAALVEIAAYDDESANLNLSRTGSYSGFDSPHEVITARAALGLAGDAGREPISTNGGIR